MSALIFLFLDENNWNPIEWERAAEELTWERVSLIFILFLSYENVTDCIHTVGKVYLMLSCTVYNILCCLVSYVIDAWPGWFIIIFGKMCSI